MTREAAENSGRRLSVAIEGGDVALLRFGREGAPPLLFAHANGFCASAYRRMFLELGGRFDIFAADLRGHGRTALPAPIDGHRSMAIFGEDLRRIKAALGAHVSGRRWVLAGHSLGGVAAAAASPRASRWCARPRGGGAVGLTGDPSMPAMSGSPSSPDGRKASSPTISKTGSPMTPGACALPVPRRGRRRILRRRRTISGARWRRPQRRSACWRPGIALRQCPKAPKRGCGGWGRGSTVSAASPTSFRSRLPRWRRDFSPPRLKPWRRRSLLLCGRRTFAGPNATPVSRDPGARPFIVLTEVSPP